MKIRRAFRGQKSTQESLEQRVQAHDRVVTMRDRLHEGSGRLRLRPWGLGFNDPAHFPLQ